MMYTPKHYRLQEWFPKEFFGKMFPIYAERMWTAIDYRALITADRLRERYDTPFIMNTWYSERMIELYGNHQWRGYRDWTCPYLKKGVDTLNLSQHQWGRAQDSVPIGVIDVEEIRNDIINNPFHKDFKYIKGIELDVTWLHLDYRNWDKLNEGLFLFGV